MANNANPTAVLRHVAIRPGGQPISNPPMLPVPDAASENRMNQHLPSAAPRREEVYRRGAALADKMAKIANG